VQEPQRPGAEDLRLALQPGVDIVGVELRELAFSEIWDDVLLG